MAGTDWGKWINVALQAYGGYSSAKENDRVAKEAAKGRETVSYHTPYQNERIASLIPYMLGEQQKIYENRLRTYGVSPGDFSPYEAMLGSVGSGYAGVGMPGQPVYNAPPPQEPEQIEMPPIDIGSVPDEVLQAAIARAEQDGAIAPEVPEMRRYWEGLGVDRQGMVL